MKYKIICLYLALFFSCLAPLHAQRGYQHQISNQNVTCMTQDNDGFLWIGTNHGLNRFDGNNYLHYLANEGEANLPNDDVLSVILDSQGVVWLSTECGICSFDPVKSIFRHPEFTNFVFITQLQDFNPSYLVAEHNGQIVTINKENFQEDYHFQTQNTVYNHLLALPSLQQVWVAGTTAQNKQMVHVLDAHLKQTTSFQTSHPIESFHADQNGHVWIRGTREMTCLDAKTHTPTPNALTAFCQGKTVLFLNTNHKDLISVGIQNEGIFWYNLKTQEIIQANAWQKLTGSAYVSFMDRDGNVWLSSQTGGEPKCYTYKHLYENIDFSRMGLKFSYLLTVEADNNGILWMRSPLDFLGYDPKSHQMVYHQEGLFGVFIIDKKQRIWLISQHSLVDCYEIQGTQLKLIRKYDVGKYMNAICEDPNGNIFVSTADKIVELKEDGSMKWITAPDGAKLTGLYEAIPTNELIITTYGNKTYKFENGKFSNFELPVKSPRFFYHEEGKGYVIGSNNEGLTFYDYNTGVVNKLSTANNLAENQVKTILRDNDGNWWLGGPTSISRCSRDAKNVRHVHDTNYVERFLYAGCCKAPDGTLYYVGAGGITAIHPDRYKEEANQTPSIPLFLDMIEAGEKPFYSNTEKKLEFRYDENTLTFWFTALQLSLGKHANYAYKLEGKDKDWILAGNNHRVSYSRLGAGDYAFRVRVRLENGEWSPEELCQRFTINPAPWATWWANLIYLIILGGIAFTCWRIFLNWKVQKEMLRIAQERIQELVRNTTSTTLPELENAPVPLVEEISEPILKESDRKFMEDLYKVLDQHLDNNEFSVQQLAVELHQSYSTTYNRIKNLTGETPQHFLTTYRMNRAMELLKSRKYTVSEVSYMVGASSLANFSKAFKKKFGVSPSQAMAEE